MPLAAGVRLGPYEILNALGEGAIGEVYRALDTDLNRTVAIKLLPAGHADATALARFEREARLASSLNHPNIITIHAVGQTPAGEPYIAMELVDGQTLHALLAAGPMPMRTVADVAAQIAGGLASAHRAGVTHRDIKPQNVMVRADGLVKIVDFGLSILSQSTLSEADTGALHAPLTRSGVITGTISYMSPEQASGHAVDFRSDQFSFGSVLYEMASGRRPFARATAAQTLAAIIEESPAPPRAFNAAIPESIEITIERCLAKDPARRFASTDDMARDLDAARDRLSGSRSSTMTTGAVPARRLGRWSWFAAAGVLVASLALIPSVRARFSAVTFSTSARDEIAVLPFTNIGNNPADQPFSDGLVEILTAQLTEVGRAGGTLDVVPASDVRAAKVTSARDAGTAFGVSHVLTGSVQRTANHVRITVNLIDARTRRQIDARTIDSELQDVVAMQDDTVRQVAELVGASLVPAATQALKVGGTSVSAAYDAYLQARGHLQQYQNLDRVDQAIGEFQRAVSADPNFALAHAGLGEAFWRKYQLTKDPRWPSEARASCARALAIADQLAAVHVTLGVIDVGTGRAADAVTELSQVLTRDPLNADAHRELGTAYQRLGKNADAEASFKKALEIRPNSWANHNELARLYILTRRFDEAEAQYKRVIDLTPMSDTAYSNLGALYFTSKRYDLAEQNFRKSVEIKPNDGAYSNLGTLYFAQARYPEAARALAQATELEGSKYKSQIWANLASALYWAPGERANARPAYARALALAGDELRVTPGDRRLLFRIADCQSRLGQPAAARKALADALAPAPPVSAADWFKAGVIYEQLGDRSRALAMIQKAIDAGHPRADVDRSPELMKLRADARFVKQ